MGSGHVGEYGVRIEFGGDRLVVVGTWVWHGALSSVSSRPAAWPGGAAPTPVCWGTVLRAAYPLVNYRKNNGHALGCCRLSAPRWVAPLTAL
jgi:hypothetical protein